MGRNRGDTRRSRGSVAARVEGKEAIGPVPGPRRWRLGAAIAVGLVVLSVATFAPTLGNGFVEQWDDQENFLENVHYRGLGPSQIRWAWTEAKLGVYQQLSTVAGGEVVSADSY